MWTMFMSSSSKSTFSKLISADERDRDQLSNSTAGRPAKPRKSSLNLDEEYRKTLRSKSYIDLYSKVHHHHLIRTSTSLRRSKEVDDGAEEEREEHRLQHAHTSPSPRSSASSYGDHIPDFLLEPSQESLLASASDNSTSSSRSRFHLHLNTLLFDFFDTTHQASTACVALLISIDRARSHHRSIHRLLLNLSTTTSSSSFSPCTFSRLSSLLELDNPLSPKNLSHFHLIHSRYPTLTRRLASARRKISRRLKLLKFTKNASGVAVIALSCAVVVAAAVIASHAAVAAAAAPVVTAAGGVRGMGNWFRGWMRLERAKARMDAAERGAYIVGRDLDTMSRMVRRVHDEVEHGRDVGRMVVRNREWEMVREVVKEIEGRGGEVGLGLEEQLEELEEHVYLCLITINRSRRLVARDLMEHEEGTMMV